MGNASNILKKSEADPSPQWCIFKTLNLYLHSMLPQTSFAVMTEMKRYDAQDAHTAFWTGNKPITLFQSQIEREAVSKR